jgi:hypothetical protein
MSGRRDAAESQLQLNYVSVPRFAANAVDLPFTVRNGAAEIPASRGRA